MEKEGQLLSEEINDNSLTERLIKQKIANNICNWLQQQGVNVQFHLSRHGVIGLMSQFYLKLSEKNTREVSIYRFGLNYKDNRVDRVLWNILEDCTYLELEFKEWVKIHNVYSKAKEISGLEMDF